MYYIYVYVYIYIFRESYPDKGFPYTKCLQLRGSGYISFLVSSSHPRFFTVVSRQSLYKDIKICLCVLGCVCFVILSSCLFGPHQAQSPIKVQRRSGAHFSFNIHGSNWAFYYFCFQFNRYTFIWWIK